MAEITQAGRSLLHQVRLDEDLFSRVCKSNDLFPGVVLGMISRESGTTAAFLRYERKYKWLYLPHLYTSPHYSLDTEEALQRFSFGPLQIMGATAREHGYRGDLLGLKNSVVGFIWGTKYLKHLVEKYGNFEDAVSAYNQGSPKKRMLSGDYVNKDYVDYVYRRSEEFYG